MNTFHTIFLAALLIAAPALYGQTQGNEESGPRLGRFSVGGRVHILFNNLMNSETLTSSTSEPPVQTTITTNSTSSHLGGGATVEFAILDHVCLSADILYRKAGYKSGVDIVEGLDDEETEDEDERLYTTQFEGTEASYWDIPVVVRLYDAPWREKRSKVFLDVGFAIRRVSNVRTFREVIYPDGTNEVDQTPVTPVNLTLPGLVLGGGFQFQGAAGLKVMPAIRYTRWLGDTFHSPPTRSHRNQIEFVFGVMF